MIENIIAFFRKLFRRKHEYCGTADLNHGFHPELLFLINLPYAEYVDFEEINEN